MAAIPNIPIGGLSNIPSLGEAIKKLSHSLLIPHSTEHPILITEGCGPVAYRVATRLLAVGYKHVRVGVNDPSRLREMAEHQGVEVVEFDWEKPDSYEPALRDVQSVFCVLPHHKDWEEQFRSFLDACKKAGVKNFVKLSFYHALASESDRLHNAVTAMTGGDDVFLHVPLVLMHRACDEILMKYHGIPNYVILFASHFMSNPLVYQSENIQREHKFYGASAGKGVNYVSPNDVAEVAVRALLAPHDHHRVGYTLTGPAAVKDQDVAELLSRHLHNVKVEYVDQSIREFVRNVPDTDWGPALDVVYLELAKSSGAEDSLRFVSKDIERVCQRPAETFEEYLGNQDVFTPQEFAYLKPA